MAHIHTKPGEHDHTASAFIVRVDSSNPKLLLHMHKKLGVLLQPGGHIELDETPWQAICHEIVEETGYALDQLKILQPPIRINHLTNTVTHPQPVVHNTHNFDPQGNHKHTDIAYAFITNQKPANKPEDGESTNLRWVSLKDLRDIDSSEIYENVREIGEFIIAEILNEWQEVEISEFQT